VIEKCLKSSLVLHTNQLKEDNEKVKTKTPSGVESVKAAQNSQNIIINNCTTNMLGALNQTETIGWRKKRGILSNCKYSENSMTEFRGNLRTSAKLYAKHSH